MRRVRIGATVRGAFDIVLNLRVLVGCAGGWSILLLATILADWALELRTQWWGGLGLATVRELAFAGIAVNVHRRVLLGESPSRLRLGRSEMTYAWRAFVMGLFSGIAGLVVLLVYFLGSYLFDIGLAGSTLLGFLCACLALFLLIEFIGSLLVLPAAAVNQPGFRWSDAWEAAEGNRLAIWFVGVICALPLALPSIALTAIDPWLARPGASFVAEVAQWMLNVAQSILNAGWISLVFSGLVDGNPDFADMSSESGGSP